MEYTKTLIPTRKDLKKRVLKLANNRENEDLPNATQKSIFNEALELGLNLLEDADKQPTTIKPN